MIVRWSLDELPGVLDELGVARPLLVASERWDGLDLPHVARWSEVPSDRIEVPPEADALLAVGGGSAIDTAHGASASSRPAGRLGADDVLRRRVDADVRRALARPADASAAAAGANLAAIVYDVELTLDLPRAETVGTALNALAHCAEALYVDGRNDAADARALGGARADRASGCRASSTSRTTVDARTELLRGAAHAGEALGARRARRSRTRWRRRSAGATASRTAR